MPLDRRVCSILSPTLLPTHAGNWHEPKDTQRMQPSPPLKILVADDSAIYRKLLAQSLPESDYSVLLAKNGREAMDLFAQHQPSIVITDWTMPDLSGLELCERIRHDFAQIYTYLILLSANTDKEEIIQGLSVGADDYLTKPFHPGELLARVRVGRRVVELHREIQAKNRQLEEMALTDALTGLPNRRAIDIWVTRQLSAAARHGFPIWVAIGDLDRFKLINDNYGHEAGDEVLKAFADILRKQTRSSNICARLGGEEFIIVITHVETQDNATIAFERIRSKFAAHKFKFNGQDVSATVSFGVAGFSGAMPPDFNQLVSRADAALYSAKRLGRNRIEFAP